MVIPYKKQMYRQKFKRVQISSTQTLKSGLEELVFNFLKKENCTFKYEGMKITYFQPEIKKTYTPDFIVKKLIIETTIIFFRFIN